MDNNLNNRIAVAKELLRTIRFAAMATVNADGSPLNSPLFFIPDPKLKYFYWGSHPDSLHSQNALHTGKIFATIFDERGGLYMAAENAHILEGGKLASALEAHNVARARFNKKPITIDYYTGANPQRMWAATITHFWVNLMERDADGRLIRDSKQEISRENLSNAFQNSSF
ncbi:MAG: pyridoxamine 5'-phosphate oxidase family protein [Candidatus Liptonbacteria bacterium]|nr:pyridoxamine 5'-phosphate oxidase family protein [Candidatus Liptonbacteria bacterium]